MCVLYTLPMYWYAYHREQYDSLVGSIRECRNSISKLKSGGDHKLDNFGRWMVPLVSAINSNSHRFQKKPMGPLGSMITIKDQKWTIAIQRCIGTGNLYAFVVDNASDAAILRQIMEDVFQRERAPLKVMPSIIKYQYTVNFYSCSPRVSICVCACARVCVCGCLCVQVSV